MRAISPNLDWSYDRDDHYLADLAAFGPFYRSAGWTDTHIPRTEKPVRFIPFVGSPSYTTRAECRAKSLRFPA